MRISSCLIPGIIIWYLALTADVDALFLVKPGSGIKPATKRRGRFFWHGIPPTLWVMSGLSLLLLLVTLPCVLWGPDGIARGFKRVFRPKRCCSCCCCTKDKRVTIDASKNDKRNSTKRDSKIQMEMENLEHDVPKDDRSNAYD